MSQCIERLPYQLKNPHSRRKPESTYQATEPLKGGPRLSPGMRFFWNNVSGTERAPFGGATERGMPHVLCRGQGGRLLPGATRFRYDGRPSTPEGPHREPAACPTT